MTGTTLTQWLDRFRHVLLPPTSSPDVWQSLRLARTLGLPAGRWPDVRLGPRYHYRPFTVLKPDGRERRLLAPSPALKALQRKLLNGYLAKLPVHPAATAFRSGGSIVANAKRHAGQAVIATVDLADFFESTRADRVRGFFIKEGWRDDSLALLMRLCVYKNGLPQGAPTSPGLSNLVNAELDGMLHELASRAGARYTRYGDDLTFSWRADSAPRDFEAMATDLIHHFGYEIQSRKGWAWHKRADSPQIAGVLLAEDGSLHPSPEVREAARQAKWDWWWKRDNESLARLKGYEGFFEMLKR